MDDQTQTAQASPVPRRFIPAAQQLTGLFARHWGCLMLYGAGVLLCILLLQAALLTLPLPRPLALLNGVLLVPALHVFMAMVGFRVLYNREHGVKPWWRVGASRLILPALAVTLLMQLGSYAILWVVMLVLGSLGMVTAGPPTANGFIAASGAVMLVYVVIAVIMLVIAPRLVPWIPLVSLRQLGPVTALRRSWGLAFDSWWFTVGLVAFYAVFAVLIWAAVSSFGAWLGAALAPDSMAGWWFMAAVSKGAIAFSVALMLPLGYVLVGSLEAREVARLERLRPVSRQYERQ